MSIWKFSFWIMSCILCIGITGCKSGKGKNPNETSADSVWTKSQVIELIEKVNDYWQAENPEPAFAFWHPAAYHTGNIAAYKVTGNEAYKKYSEDWAEKNQWKGATSDNKSKWKYNYGETMEHVLFGDWQICFQTYIDLYNMDREPAEYKIARAKEVMKYEMSTPNDDYWWWADGLYMVMPVMTKLYKVTDDQQYLDKLYEYFTYARNLMYDEESALFYRDGKYIYPKHKTNQGSKDFWSRGNGWVFAGLAKVLQDLPEDDAHRTEYIEIYKVMAKSLATAQQEEGYWTRSLLDPVQAPGRETSGTAFFIYGYLWGVNNGLLNKETYEPVINKGWKYLTEIALQPSGKIGYVQPIGERADQHNNVGQETTADFGVGAFLLAASEMTKYVLKSPIIVSGKKWLDTNGDIINAHGGGILYYDGIYYWYGECKGDSTYWNPKVPSWECYRTEAGGVSCYSSQNLADWKFEGFVLPSEKVDTTSDLHYSNVLERPKVIYNDKTKKFVMWLHVDSHDYAKAAAGVAVSDTPNGKFEYVGSMRPNNAMSRDMTLFKDDDGKAYHVYSSEENKTLYISELTEDYLKPTGKFTRNFIDRSREAPAVFKRNSKYYILSSGCTGWDPNQAEYAVADSMMGEWKVMDNPCTGKDAGITFYGQSTHVIKIEGKKDAYIAMFDKWNKTNLIDSRYIWLPIQFKGDTIDIAWQDRWSMDEVFNNK